jgi:hypothetical protein
MGSIVEMRPVTTIPVARSLRQTPMIGFYFFNSIRMTGLDLCGEMLECSISGSGDRIFLNAGLTVSGWGFSVADDPPVTQR